MTTTLERAEDIAARIEHAQHVDTLSMTLCNRFPSLMDDHETVVSAADFPTGAASPCVECHKATFGVQRSARLLRDTTESDRRRAEMNAIPDDEGFVTINRENY